MNKPATIFIDFAGETITPTIGEILRNSFFMNSNFKAGKPINISRKEWTI